MAANIKSGSKVTLNQTFSSFSQGLKTLMNKYFETLDDLLHAMSMQKESEIDSQLYKDAMDSIRVHKLNVLVSNLKTIQETFKKFMKNEFDYFTNLYSYHKNNAITELNNANEIEENITQNYLRNKFDIKYSNQLNKTLLVFSVLKKQNLEPKFNPISPQVLISAFGKSIRLLHLNHNVKDVLYKHYEFNILSNLQQLYDEVIQSLISDQSEKILNDKPNASSKIQNKKYNIPHSKINEIVNGLQVKFQSGFSLAPERIEKALMSEIGRVQISESRYIDQHDLYSIDFVFMHFQAIAHNQNIHSKLKDVIFKLQFAYLKYLTQEDSFVEDKSHPAQLLLSEIQSSCVGWSPKFDDKNEFINNLTKLVNTFVETKLLTRAIFEQQLNGYLEFISQLENKFVKEQQRIKKRERGKAQIVAAMKTVDALIELKTKDFKLPDFVTRILCGPWKNLLSLLLVRYSDTSDEYLKLVIFIDDLINILDLSQHDNLLEDNIVKLAVEYKEGLKLVAYNGVVLEDKVKNFHNNIIKYHKLGVCSENKILKFDKNHSNNIKTKRHNKVSVREKIKQEKLEKVNPDRIEGGHNINTYLLNKLPIGSWVEFPRPNRDSVKAQLSWINPKSGRYIFVNDRGLKVTDKSLEEILSDLKVNKIVVVK